MIEQGIRYASEQEGEAAAPDQAASVKLRTLKELTLTLLKEVESLKGDGNKFEGRPGVDFMDEVRRFEVELIRWALMHTGGHQRRAARMLNLKVTTLNAKIKRYGIRPHALNAADLLAPYTEDRAA